MLSFDSPRDYKQSRQHVTRNQMINLEAGRKVTLNSSQLEELLAQAPEWVGITVHESRSLLGQHVVSIKDHRPGAQQLPQQKLGIHYDPRTGSLTKSEKTK